MSFHLNYVVGKNVNRIHIRCIFLSEAPLRRINQLFLYWFKEKKIALGHKWSYLYRSVFCLTSLRCTWRSWSYAEESTVIKVSSSHSTSPPSKVLGPANFILDGRSAWWSSHEMPLLKSGDAWQRGAGPACPFMLPPHPSLCPSTHMPGGWSIGMIIWRS